MVEANAPYQLITVVACLGIALSACEELATRRLYAEGGLLSWPVLRVVRRRAVVPRVQQLLDRVFENRPFTAFLVVKLATAVCLAAITILAPRAYVVAGLLSVAVLTELMLMRRRSIYGLDGADHMYIVVFLGLTVYWLMPQDSIASIAGILYIAAQAVLSYFVAGIAKLGGSSWRNGTALGGIMATQIYGNGTAAALLRDRRRLGRLVCWTVIAFEVTFCFVLVVDPRTMWMMLLLGGLFHGSAAVLMGLNSFFLAFVSTYPAIAFANELVRRLVA